MGALINVQSGRKGSNPGGKCVISSQGRVFDAYLKYCLGSKIPRGRSSFVPEHQPIYEAITFKLVKTLGLHVPEFFVLRNAGQDVVFTGDFATSPKDHKGREYYFVSRWEHESPSPQREEVANSLLSSELPYLDLLMVEDIIGKRQNYLFQRGESGSRVVYCDLGCSFVKAIRGALELPQRVLKCSRLAHNCKKQERKHLKGKQLILVDGSSEVDLHHLATGLEELTIPCLNPAENVPLGHLLPEETIEEIGTYLTHTFAEDLPSLKKAGLIRRG